jgi:phage terminase small subunit
MLTRKQEAFINEYCVTLNATQSAIKAGYKSKNANATGAENLTKPYIKHEIEKRLKEKANQNNINAELVLNGIKEIAFKSNAKDTDRLRALELLGKYLKLFTDKVESETKVITNEPIRIVFDDKMKDWAK